MRSVVLLDNNDSFTYNLVQYLQVLGARVEVVPRDARPAQVERARPQSIVISPGPGAPQEAAAARAVFAAFVGRVPMLGVCLGMQIIAHALGASVVRAPQPVHGKTSQIRHDGRGLFAGLPNPFAAMRYHSLMVAREGLPAVLEVTAESEDGVAMGIRHRQLPVEGVQFHPESILTEAGMALLENFLEM